jgi:hypothetical protein
VHPPPLQCILALFLPSHLPYEHAWIESWLALWPQIDNCKAWDAQWFQVRLIDSSLAHKPSEGSPTQLTRSHAASPSALFALPSADRL